MYEWKTSPRDTSVLRDVHMEEERIGALGHIASAGGRSGFDRSLVGVSSASFAEVS